MPSDTSTAVIPLDDAVIAQRIDKARLLFFKFENDLRAVTQELRKLFDEQNIGEMKLEITVSGRVHGALKLEFTLSNASYSGQTVKGASIHPTMLELFRRLGWQATNNPKSLTYTGTEEDSF